MLGKSPGVTAAAVLSLGLGIGANAAIFSLVDGLWLRPMAVRDPGQIVRVLSVTNQDRAGLLSYPEYEEFARQIPAFSGVVATGGRGAFLPKPDGTTQLLLVNVVSANFFEVLGVKPAYGRLWNPGDSSVVVLGYNFWKRQFGGDPGVVGTEIQLTRGGKVPFTIIGILPAEFAEIERSSDRDLWLPPQSWERLAGRGDLERRGFRWFHVLGRLAPHQSIGTARAQLQTVAARLEHFWPETNAGHSAGVISDAAYRWNQAGANGLLLLGVVLLLVLLCSVNVANLLLARGVARAREVAVRLAVGAGRARLIRQLMTESAVLGLCGLAVGLLLGGWITTILPALVIGPPGFPKTLQFGFDSRVFEFSFVVSIATTLFFGIAPAWRGSRADLVPALKGASPLEGQSRARFPLRQALVISQLAISLTLLATSGVLVESFVNTRTADLGLSRQPLLLLFITMGGKQAPQLYREATERVRNMPGVRELAFATRAPLSLSGGGLAQRVFFPDRAGQQKDRPEEIKFNTISSNYLHVMGTRLLRGREFNATDQSAGALVALVSQRMAERYWPSQDPINKTIRLDQPNGPEYRIAGVVQDVPINQIGEPPEPYLYLPYWRFSTDEITLVAQTAGNALALAEPARRTLRQLDRHLDPALISTQEQLIRFSARVYQMTAELVVTLGVIALMLTAIGLYGVVSYSVQQRTREIGIRMALGAERGRTLLLVLAGSARLGGLGIALGLPMALVATRLARSMLFGVNPWNAGTFLMAAGVLLLVLTAASLVPARRATRIDPLVALRQQ